jgi:hypothetical protein
MEESHTVGVVKTRATLTAGHGPRLYAITLRRIHLHRQALRRQARLKPPSQQEAFHLAGEAKTRRRRSSVGSKPRRSTRPPARPLPGMTAAPRQDPCRGHRQGHSQAHACQDSTAVPMQLLARPAEQAPAWRQAASTLTQQAPAWWHADLREGLATAPAQLPAYLQGATRLVVPSVVICPFFANNIVFVCLFTTA